MIGVTRGHRSFETHGVLSAEGIVSNFRVPAFFNSFWSAKSISADQSSEVIP